MIYKAKTFCGIMYRGSDDMKFTCPHCGEKTISLKEKISVGNVIPSKCKNCNNGYINNKMHAIYAGIIGIIAFLMIPKDASGTVFILFFILYVLLFISIYIFLPVKKSDIEL